MNTRKQLIPVIGLWILCVGVAVTGAYCAYGGRLAERQFAANLQWKIAQVASSVGVPGAAAADAGQARYRPSQGHYGAIEKHVFAYLDRSATDHAGYLQDLGQTGFTDLLNPDRLNADEGLVESRRIIAAARTTSEAFGRRVEANLETLRRDLHEEDLPPRWRRQFVDGLVRGFEDSRAERLEIMRLELEIIDEYAALIEDLAAAETWEAEGEQMRFTSPADSKVFLDHVNRVYELVERQNALRGGQYRRTMEQIENRSR